MLDKGVVAQYRKVGKVEILGVAFDLYPNRTGDELAQPYRVQFITGPRRYRETDRHIVWLYDSDAI